MHDPLRSSGGLGSNAQPDEVPAGDLSAAPQPPGLRFVRPPVVVLDACTLFSTTRRDVLLHLARRGLLVPHWTDRILDEMTRNLRRRAADLAARREPGVQAPAPATLQRIAPRMDVMFPGARMATATTSQEAQFTGVHPGDRHVAAAARAARLALGFHGTAASAAVEKAAGRTPAKPPRVGVVTENLKHFPAAALADHDLFVASADAFLCAVRDWSGPLALATLAAHCVGLARPPRELPEYLESLRVAELPSTAGLVAAGLAVVLPVARAAHAAAAAEAAADAAVLSGDVQHHIGLRASDAAYAAAFEAATAAGMH